MLFTDFYLFVYDIHEAKALRQVVKRLEMINSMRIQKSVFEIQGDRVEIMSLIDDVKDIVDINTDRIAIIPLCQNDYDKVEFYGILSRRPTELPSFYIL